MADTARDAATTYLPISWYRFPKTNDDIQAIASLVTTICHNLANFQAGYAPEPKIDILHLSDLHFTTTDDFDKISMRHDSIIDYLARKGARISFIVVTGDITDNGLPHEFDAADKWLSTFQETLMAHFGIMPQILIVPGNHDHCIALENAYRLRFDRKDKVVKFDDVPIDKLTAAQSRIAEHALGPYKEFWYKYHGRLVKLTGTIKETLNLPDPTHELWFDTRFLWEGLLFMGINTSARKLGHPPEKKLSATILKDLQKHLMNIYKGMQKQGYKINCPICPILLMHHPYSEIRPEISYIKNTPLYPDIVFDGHGHAPTNDVEDSSVLVVSSGTAQGGEHRPEDTLRSVNWIRTSFDAKAHKRHIEVHPLGYTPNGWAELTDSANKYTIDGDGHIARSRKKSP